MSTVAKSKEVEDTIQHNELRSKTKTFQLHQLEFYNYLYLRTQVRSPKTSNTEFQQQIHLRNNMKNSNFCKMKTNARKSIQVLPLKVVSL